MDLNPIPTADSDFTGLKGDPDCLDGRVDLGSDRRCVAEFTPKSTNRSVRLVVKKLGSGQGTIQSAPAGINCGSDCIESYDEGTRVSLTASPAPGSSFARWKGNADCLDGVVTMNSRRTCAAVFRRQGK